MYAVNLVGANSNVGEVTNVNMVSVRTSNSAGLVHSISPSDVWADPQASSLTALNSRTDNL
jgi:hypothetical protein